MSRLGRAFISAAFSLALFGLGRFLFNLLGLRVFGAVAIGQLNVSISSWTLMAVIVATVPSVVASKYVSAFLASAEETRAARVLAACLSATWVLSLLAIIGWTVTSRPGGAEVWPFYGLSYATYLVIRAAYFSHQRVRAMVQSEVLGFCIFALVLAVGLTTGNTLIASIALAIQPAVYCIKGLWDFRASIRFGGALSELQGNFRDYGVFSSASLANAITGMAAYHLSIVIAGRLLAQPADVGFLSVLLSTMSPINLVPQAVGSVLFAEFARRHGAKDERGPQRVALRATLLIQLFVFVFVGTLLVIPEFVIHRVGLPNSSILVGTWTWLIYAVGLTIASAPCGHLLNATKHAPRQAIASMTFLVFGVAIGLWGMPRVGILAAGWMKLGVEGGLAWTRMAIAQRVEPWIDRRWVEILGFQVCFGALFLQALSMGAEWIRVLTILAGGLFLLVRARNELRQLIAGFRWRRA